MSRMKKKPSLRQQDPYLQRERQKYPHPLPSREWIIEILTTQGVPMSVENLSGILSIDTKEESFFRHRLNAMVRDGQIYINRRGAVCVAEKIDLIKCRVEGHKDGYGFAVPTNPDQQSDFVLSEKQMRQLMHGDIIAIRPTGKDRRGRREGRVLEVLERAQSTVVARVYIEHGTVIAKPEDKRLSQAILIAADNQLKPQNGQVVEVKIDSYPKENRLAIGHIIEILGDYADSGMEIEIAVRKHHLPHRFSTGCLNAVAKIPDSVRKSDSKNRQDIRHLPLMTIDGETARDFDDAVYAQKEGRNYRLWVAIADVDYYVPSDGAIDEDAQLRGTSVYFPRRVIPMLPEKLSNGLCSLNPDEDRLCMVCEMDITYAGNIREYRFYPALMRSHARLTYTQAWDYINSDAPHPQKKSLDTLYALFLALFKQRQKRGAMEVDSTETQMIFDDNGKIASIIPVERNDAHRLIEECMLCANVCAAQFLQQHQHPTLYRAHAAPSEEKLTHLREQLALLGLSLGGGNKPKPKDFALLNQDIAHRADKNIIQIMMLKSMQQAVYQPKNEGHFGLAYEAYAHFTSPIRRYPDLLTHRAIKAVLRGEVYVRTSWQKMGVHCSLVERRADDASRDVERWLKTFYMRDKVGEVFQGTVSGMTGFGLFVTLDGIHIDGMIHVSDLGQDYFHYRPEILAMEGERSGVRFCIGDSVTVRIAQADLDTRRIDLTLVDKSQKMKKSKKKSPRHQ